MAYSQDTAFPAMEDLLAGARAELIKRELPDVGFAMIQPGINWVIDHAGNEGCDDCDELIVWTEQSYPISSSGFPDIDVTGTCSSGLAHILHVGIYRKALGIDEDSDPPTPEEQIAAARAQAADREALRAAVKCVFGGHQQYVLGSYTNYGPDGFAVGGDWQLTVGQVDD